MHHDKDLTLPGLVHDLNNVFQTLVDAADLLAADPRWAPLSQTILRCVEQGKHITASLEAGGGAARFETILANAISFVEDFVRARRRPRVRFACRVEPGIELRNGWAWERVLINLFLNARRAMPMGGAIHVSAHRSGGGIEIGVRDEGTGIAPELLEHLFEPHVTGSASSGLGLHIVHAIVQQDGGKIRAANHAGGRGAEFVITLPASAAAPRRSRPARASGA
jgi:signal transduction histidine kinase